MDKKVLILYNGGTIGMKPSSQGYAPEVGFLQSQMNLLPAFHDDRMPSFDILEQSPLIDSANMFPDRWWGIAQDIAKYYAQYDGFVVLHGTDTMAYTASALPFILQGLDKPVILTGSQIPLCELRNDAQENLITSLLIAANHPIPEVCLYFGGRLIRGCRAVKVDARGFQAFDSPNYPLLGDIGISIEIFWKRILITPNPKPVLRLHPLHYATVAALRLFPGISASVLENILQAPLQGLVLETYGVGNGPIMDPMFLRVLRQANERGIVLVNCTQCLRGRVQQKDYAAGQVLSQTGLISGLDMTTEAALAKLHYLLSSDEEISSVKAKIGLSICGELSI